MLTCEPHHQRRGSLLVKGGQQLGRRDRLVEPVATREVEVGVLATVATLPWSLRSLGQLEC